MKPPEQSRILTDKERRAFYREQRRWGISFAVVVIVCFIGCAGFVIISFIGDLSAEHRRANIQFVR